MQTLDNVVYGMNNAKIEIIQYIAQAISNPKACGNVLGLEGPPGTGKTTLIRQGLAKVLGKPCVCIALGGASDSSFLDGHGYTYEGSQCGQIITGLKTAGAMDPIYFFDEVDKVSNTSTGLEINGVLIHLIDPSQNYQYHDKYYAEVDFDLSKATFIFCFNDANKIDPILRDRMKIIKIPGYNLEEKAMIAKEYLIPKICKQVGLKSSEVIWDEKALQNLILLSMEEQGVRTLEQDLKTLIMKINTLRFSNAVPYNIKGFKLPFSITPDVLIKLQQGPNRKNSLSLLNNNQHLIISKEAKIVKEVNISKLDTHHRVLLSPMPTQTKALILRKLDSAKANPDSSESEKLKVWLDHVLRLPFGKTNPIPVSINSTREQITTYLDSVRNKLDQSVYGLEEPKRELLNYVVQRITNPNAPGVIFALSGPPGTGKTTLIKNGFSKALGRPFGFIPLGGAKDSSFLKGHSFTYVGSIPGKIVEILQNTKSMDPIIVFDELDKVSAGDVIGSLMHIIDSTQNSHFTDRYLGGIDIDLSKVTFIFSFNDASKIDKTLLDRIKVLNIKEYSKEDKLKIAKKYLLPKIIKEFGIDNTEIVWPTKVIQYLIDKIHEKGVRKLEQAIRTVLSKLNTAKYVAIKEIKEIKFPLKLTIDLVSTLISNHFTTDSGPPIGLYL